MAGCLAAPPPLAPTWPFLVSLAPPFPPPPPPSAVYPNPVVTHPFSPLPAAVPGEPLPLLWLMFAFLPAKAVAPVPPFPITISLGPLIVTPLFLIYAPAPPPPEPSEYDPWSIVDPPPAPPPIRTISQPVIGDAVTNLPGPWKAWMVLPL